MTSRSEIIERLEKATGPDRNLDAMIHWLMKDGVGVGATQDAPAYTGSLDAAMTLVPEGCEVDLQTRRRYAAIADWRGRDYGLPLGTSIDAATPILALCIAALKAGETT